MVLPLDSAGNDAEIEQMTGNRRPGSGDAQEWEWKGNSGKNSPILSKIVQVL
jgi:hypothetical protein